MDAKWLEWAQQLQAIAQHGFTYGANPYDLERYGQVRQIVAAIMASHTNVKPSFVCNLFEREEGYATPKVDVRGAVFHDDKLLLVKEREDDCWTLPGGWVDVGESPSEAIAREAYEESDYQTKVVKLVALYDRNHPRHDHSPLQHHMYNSFFNVKSSVVHPPKALQPLKLHSLPLNKCQRYRSFVLSWLKLLACLSLIILTGKLILISLPN